MMGEFAEKSEEPGPPCIVVRVVHCIGIPGRGGEED